MEIELLRAAEMSGEVVESWSRMQQTNPTLDSPYFRPEFTRLAGRIWPMTEVAVLRDQGVPQAYFPFERRPGNAGRPVADVVNDFQGLIANPDLKVDLLQVLDACGLKSYVFDHALAAQSALGASFLVLAHSPYIDLSQGFEAYRRQRGAAGSQSLAKTLRKARKLEHEHGPLRLDLSTHDPEVLDCLIRWKSKNDGKRNGACIVDVPWFRQLADGLLMENQPDFAGMLSALYAGDELIAVHLGMRSRTVCHWWFPTYNHMFERYSPGLMLLALCARELAEQGIRRIDLGKGELGFKNSMKSGDLVVAEGIVDRRAWAVFAWYQWLALRDKIRCSPLRTSALRVDRWLTHSRLWFGLDR